MLQHSETKSCQVPSTPAGTPLPAPLGRGPWRTFCALEGQPAVPRVVSQHGGTWHFHDARRVSRFHASDKYTCFRVEGSEYLLTESLSSLEKRLRFFGFMRTHRAELVNLNHVRSVRRCEQTFELQLADGQRVVTSRRLTAEVRRRLTF